MFVNALFGLLFELSIFLGCAFTELCVCVFFLMVLATKVCCQFRSSQYDVVYPINIIVLTVKLCVN